MEIKLEEITVTLQSNHPKNPNMIQTAKAQQSKGRTTHLIFLKKNHIETIMRPNTPTPNTYRSLSIRSTISDVIIGRPPKNIFALFRYLSRMERTFLISSLWISCICARCFLYSREVWCNFISSSDVKDPWLLFFSRSSSLTSMRE